MNSQMYITHLISFFFLFQIRVDQYFSQMHKIKNDMSLPSRVRFMVQDVIELRLVNISFFFHILFKVNFGNFSEGKDCTSMFFFVILLCWTEQCFMVCHVNKKF